VDSYIVTASPALLKEMLRQQLMHASHISQTNALPLGL
jgi:hypothetical protein